MTTNFERGLTELKSRLRAGHPDRLLDFSTLEARLLDNLHYERQHGTTEAMRATRSQVLRELNRLAMDTLGITFNDLCKGVGPPMRRPKLLWFSFGARRALKLYRDWLRSQFERLYVFGTVSNLLDAYATLKLVEDLEVTFGSMPSTAKRLDIEEVLLARRVVILGEPGSGKTTLLKHLALRLTMPDVALGSVVRTLSPHPLGKHIDNLHKGLLYLHHRDVLYEAACVTRFLLMMMILLILMACIVWTCIQPSVRVDYLKLNPLEAEQQTAMKSLASFLFKLGVWFEIIAFALALVIVWSKVRDRVNRFTETLRLHLATSRPLPVFVRLSDFARQQCDLSDYLTTMFANSSVSLHRQALEQLLARGQIWLLCDGLDETGSKRNYWTIQQRITDFADKYPRVPVIVTCRTAAFDRHSMHGFARYSIDRLDDEQVRSLVEKWFYDVPERGTSLLHNLYTSARIRALAANPFLLSITAVIFRRSGQLPQRRGELYQACVQQLLWARDIEKGQQQLYEVELKQRILREVAYEIHRREELSTPVAELYAYLRRVEPDVHSPPELLREIEERTGLLYRISEAEYAFRHLSIQEYFASLAVISHQDRIERLITQMEEPWWREVVVLLMCQGAVVPQLRDALIECSKASTNGLLLAIACLNEGTDLPSDLRQEIIGRTVNWLRTSADYLRLQEIGGLDRALGDELWGEVADWLREDNPGIRLRALSVATLTRSDKALSAAIALAVDDPDAELRKTAITALTKIDEISATEQLVAAIWSSSDFSRRQRAAEAIARLSDRACQRLTSLLREPGIKRSVRIAVAEVLDSIMVEVPGGEFTMGDSTGAPDEGPAHVDSVGSFWIDKYLVTNAQYARFIKATGYRAPYYWRGDECPEGEEGLPVTHVSWYDAKAYANWVGKRLPTEAEWEKAARDVDSRRYPWGDKFETNHCNWFESSSGGHLTPVGSFPLGISPFGVHDMAGNVWEWVEDWYQPYPGSLYQSEQFGQKCKVTRGGAAGTTHESNFRCACRTYSEPEQYFGNVGFRCACDASTFRP
jgi:formylglycine-generating enzyme required for sulfatase activity/energy-coupling factor transporter ATP-binding protein EcfA2